MPQPLDADRIQPQLNNNLPLHVSHSIHDDDEYDTDEDHIAMAPALNPSIRSYLSEVEDALIVNKPATSNKTNTNHINTSAPARPDELQLRRFVVPRDADTDEQPELEHEFLRVNRLYDEHILQLLESTQRDAGAGDGQGVVQKIMLANGSTMSFKPQKHKADIFMSGKPRPAPLPKHNTWPIPFQHADLSKKLFVLIASAKDGTHCMGMIQVACSVTVTGAAVRARVAARVRPTGSDSRV